MICIFSGSEVSWKSTHQRTLGECTSNFSNTKKLVFVGSSDEVRIRMKQVIIGGVAISVILKKTKMVTLQSSLN